MTVVLEFAVCDTDELVALLEVVETTVDDELKTVVTLEMVVRIVVPPSVIVEAEDETAVVVEVRVVVTVAVLL